MGRRVGGFMSKSKSGDVSGSNSYINSGSHNNIVVGDKDETILLMQKMLDDMREIIKQKDVHIIELESITRLQGRHIMSIQKQLAFALFRKKD